MNFCCFKQKTAYEMRISDWSSDVCSSVLLAHFSVAHNQADVIPVMQQALAINPQLRVIASPWSPPAWMKSSNSLIGGTLLPEYEPVLAQYLLRSEEHTSELQSLMRTSYSVFCLKKK